MTDKINSKTYDCILYDFDGTLADSFSIILSSYHDAYMAVFGKCERTKENFMSYIGLPLANAFEMHDEETAGKLVDAYLESNHKKLLNNEIKLFDGVMEELVKLKEMGIKQGIVTSKRRISLMTTIELMGLENFFDIFVTKDDTNKHKPDGEPLVYASEKLGIPLDRLMYVGDAVGDIKAANNAGCDSVFVLWSPTDLKEIMPLNPTYTIKEMSDLSCIISGTEL